MPRRVYRFILKTLKEVSFVGTRYYPVDIDPNLSPYTTVLATIWDEDHMVGQVNQTEILAWWSELYKEPQPASLASPATAAPVSATDVAMGSSEIVLQSKTQ